MLRTTSPLALRRLLALVTLLCTALLLTGCGGGSEEQEKSPRQVLREAKQHFDQARSVHIDLTTAATPTSGNGVLGASGTVTHAPAFRGDVKVVLGGLTATVPVTAVDSKVWAKLPLQTQFRVIEPGEYGAPDPADFADPQHGLSSLLGKLQGLEKGKQTRNGDQILTSYTGRLSGKAVRTVIPSADPASTYRTSIGVDEEGYARTVSVTGPFFSGAEDVTYDVTFSQYDADVTIAAPKGPKGPKG